jgi:hypothetical protein
LAKSSTHKLGFSLRLEFKIKQKHNEILKLIQQNFGGNIYSINSVQKNKIFYYNSTSFESAKKVVDYFDKFQLNSSKFIKYFK